MNKNAKIVLSVLFVAMAIAICVLSYFAFFNKDEDKDVQNDSSSSVSKEELLDEKGTQDKDKSKRLEDKLSYKEVCVNGESLCFNIPNNDWDTEQKNDHSDGVNRSYFTIKNDNIDTKIKVTLNAGGIGGSGCAGVQNIESEFGYANRIDLSSVSSDIDIYPPNSTKLGYVATTTQYFNGKNMMNMLLRRG